MSDFSFESFIRDFEVVKSLEFVLVAMLVWIVLWFILIDTLFEGLISYASSLINANWILHEYLSLTGLASTEAPNFIKDTKFGFVDFYYSIIEGGSERFFSLSKARANAIFPVVLGAFVILLIDGDWPTWTFFLMGFFLLNFLVTTFFIASLENYLEDHSDLIIDYLFPFAMKQKLKNALNQFDFWMDGTEICVEENRINIVTKEHHEALPNKLKIISLFYKGKGIGGRKLDDYAIYDPDNFERSILKSDTMIVYVSNLLNQDSNLIIGTGNVAYIKGDTQEEFYQAIRELLSVQKSKSLDLDVELLMEHDWKKEEE